MLEDLKAKAKDLEMKYADLTAAKVREVDSLSRQLDFLKVRLYYVYAEQTA